MNFKYEDQPRRFVIWGRRALSNFPQPSCVKYVRLLV